MTTLTATLTATLATLTGASTLTVTYGTVSPRATPLDGNARVALVRATARLVPQEVALATLTDASAMDALESIVYGGINGLWRTIPSSETRKSRLDDKGRPVVAWPEPMAVAMSAHWGALALADAQACADLAAMEDARIAKGRSAPLPTPGKPLAVHTCAPPPAPSTPAKGRKGRKVQTPA
jgi:hypothetical protein